MKKRPKTNDNDIKTNCVECGLKKGYIATVVMVDVRGRVTADGDCDSAGARTQKKLLTGPTIFVDPNDDHSAGIMLFSS